MIRQSPRIYANLFRVLEDTWTWRDFVLVKCILHKSSHHEDTGSRSFFSVSLCLYYPLQGAVVQRSVQPGLDHDRLGVIIVQIMQVLAMTPALASRAAVLFLLMLLKMIGDSHFDEALACLGSGLFEFGFLFWVG